MLWPLCTRQFLRIGSSLAEKSPNHSLFVIGKAKKEFKRGAALTDAEEIDFSVALANVYLDSLKEQTAVDEGFGKHRKPKENRAVPDPFNNGLD